MTWDLGGHSADHIGRLEIFSDHRVVFFMKKVVVVTGGNRGIGLFVCKNLAEIKDISYTVILTSRKLESGIEARNKLKDDFHVQNPVIPMELDITSDESVSNFANKMEEEYGVIDILVNNAGVSHMSLEIVKEKSFWEKTTYELAKKNLSTNYYGTVRVTETLLPLLLKSEKNPRIIFVTSYSGIKVQKNMKQELRNEYFRCETKEQIDSMIKSFLEHVNKGDQFDEEVGYDPEYHFLSYGVSKLCTNLYMRYLYRRYEKDQLFVLAMHPGHVTTRITSLSPDEKLTPDEGGKRVVWCCECDRKKFNGEFVNDGKILKYGYTL